MIDVSAYAPGGWLTVGRERPDREPEAIRSRLAGPLSPPLAGCECAPSRDVGLVGGLSARAFSRRRGGAGARCKELPRLSYEAFLSDVASRL